MRLAARNVEIEMYFSFFFYYLICILQFVQLDIW